MKIAHISPYYPPAIGGAENCVYYLAREQAKQGHDVVVITTSLPPLSREAFIFTPTRQELNDVKVLRLGSFIFREVPVSLNLISYLCKTDFDVIHLHLNSMPYQPEVAMLLARLKGIPIISHVHIDPESTLPWLKLYLRFTSKIIFDVSKAIIVPTKHYKWLIGTKYRHHKKVVVIPHGIDPSDFESFKKKERDEGLSILFVGRITHQKGLDRLIFAMKGILKVMPEVKLTIVGPSIPSERKYYMHILRMVNQLDLNRCVRFLGRVSKDKLLEMYNQASVFVAPSRFESFGIVLLEAMASGCLLYTSDAADE